ncbi:unnamed protein product [Ectocarpus fasciculatus]
MTTIWEASSESLHHLQQGGGGGGGRRSYIDGCAAPPSSHCKLAPPSLSLHLQVWSRLLPVRQPHTTHDAPPLFVLWHDDCFSARTTCCLFCLLDTCCRGLPSIWEE